MEKVELFKWNHPKRNFKKTDKFHKGDKVKYTSYRLDFVGEVKSVDRRTPEMRYIVFVKCVSKGQFNDGIYRTASVPENLLRKLK